MNLNNAFANLDQIVPPVVMTLGRKPAWSVEFKVSHNTNARTIIPDMPAGSVEPFMIMQRKVGRGQIVNKIRVQVNG